MAWKIGWFKPLKYHCPNTYVPYLSGYFFKISYVMKDYHKILTEDYKFSTWVSYAFFTLITILVGGLLGLVSFRNTG